MGRQIKTAALIVMAGLLITSYQNCGQFNTHQSQESSETLASSTDQPVITPPLPSATPAISTTIPLPTASPVLVTPIKVSAIESPTDVPSMMGAGIPGWVSGPAAVWKTEMAALNTVGAKMSRISMLPPTYFDEKKQLAVPEKIDSIMLAHYSGGITPIFLFEYNATLGVPMGGYDKWHAIGAAFAKRFGPGGTWPTQIQAANGYGVRIFQAFNEPDLINHIPPTAANLKNYHDALQGLADGVHSVDASLKVIPGGLAGPNSGLIYNALGFVPAIADLLNSGTIDGLDIHIYYGTQYFPPSSGHVFSAQSLFDNVKKASGITREINFYSSEFNVGLGGKIPKTSDPVDENYAAKMFMTVFWDLLGVVKNDGTLATKMALVWNIMPVEPTFTIGLQQSPWVGTTRGNLLQNLLAMTNGMTVQSSDPNKTGLMTLVGNGKKM